METLFFRRSASKGVTLDLRLETSSNPFPIDYHGPDFDIHGNNRTSRVIVPQRPRKLLEIGVIDVYSFILYTENHRD